MLSDGLPERGVTAVTPSGRRVRVRGLDQPSFLGTTNEIGCAPPRCAVADEQFRLRVTDALVRGGPRTLLSVSSHADLRSAAATGAASAAAVPD